MDICDAVESLTLTIQEKIEKRAQVTISIKNLNNVIGVNKYYITDDERRKIIDYARSVGYPEIIERWRDVPLLKPTIADSGASIDTVPTSPSPSSDPMPPLSDVMESRYRRDDVSSSGPQDEQAMRNWGKRLVDGISTNTYSPNTDSSVGGSAAPPWRSGKGMYNIPINGSEARTTSASSIVVETPSNNRYPDELRGNRGDRRNSVPQCWMYQSPTRQPAPCPVRNSIELQTHDPYGHVNSGVHWRQYGDED